MAAYGRFPVFGALRGSVAVVRRGNTFLVLDRSDGLGLAFPGGLALPWESDEKTLNREVEEETGLRLSSYTLLFRYDNARPYPARVSVYRAQAEGGLRPSWEGIPLWVKLADLQPRLMPNQRIILERILQERG
jgi:8-oxo-dGTP pyrophosphatase MutT (NUDIX family)